MKSRFAVMAASALALACSIAPHAAAAQDGINDDRVDIQVIGGSRAPQTGWAVQLVFKKPGGTYGCTGEALNSQWVLTARHCIESVSSMNVYFSNNTISRGTPIAADRYVAAPKGDIALVHLSKAASIYSFAPLSTTAYTPKSGDRARVMGYGARANGAPADGLYQADVKVLGASKDGRGGVAVHIEGINGGSNHGDSGGPLLVNGKIVAVCSTGDKADPGADIKARSNYANLKDSLSWIRRTAGV